MIRNLLFDMGGVLVHYDPPAFIAALGVTGDDAALLLREVFRSVEWVMLDRGELTDEQAIAAICPRLPERLHAHVRTLVTRWDTLKPRFPIDGMYELVQELSEKGYGLYLLSNASLRHHVYWQRIPVSRFFGDRLFISCDYRLLKPDAAFYQTALRRFDLIPDECVFIDDFPLNVEGAVRCGVHGVVFHGDAALLRAQLRSLGVEVSL